MALISKDKKKEIKKAIDSGDTSIIKKIQKKPLLTEEIVKKEKKTAASQPTTQKAAASALQHSSKLIEDARNGNLKGVQAALSQGADINTADQNGWTALIAASANGRTAILKLLIDSGANLNFGENQFGWTALIAAASNAREETVKLLIDARADLDTTDNLGWTALMHAYFHSGLQPSGYGSIIVLLEKAGADKFKKIKGYAAYELAGIAQYFRTPEKFNSQAPAKG